MRWRIRNALGVVAACSALCAFGQQPTSATAPERVGARMESTTPAACNRDRNTELGAGISEQPAPVDLVVGQGIWVWFGNGAVEDGRWSTPTTTNASVALFGTTVRCGAAGAVALMRAVRPGRATLGAQFTSKPIDGQWRLRTVVHAKPPRTVPPPGATRIRGGGLLLFPSHLYDPGAVVTFRVPRVVCSRRGTVRLDVGLFGLARVIAPDGRSTTTSWSAGLSASCSRSGTVAYHVGVDGGRQAGTAVPGDVVYVDTSGGTCPGVSVAFHRPGSTVSRGYNGPGCRTGSHDQDRRSTEPTMLIGAQSNAFATSQTDVLLNSVEFNGLPYQLQPHQLREQRSGARTLVRATATHSWYALRLHIG